MNDLTEQLATQYQQILAPYKEFLEGLDDKHSKLFLPAPYKGMNIDNRIMVLGRETRGWGMSNEWKEHNSIEELMAMYQRDYQRTKRFRGFFSLINGVREQTESDPLWVNLYCMDYNGGNPKNSPHFTMIKEISKKLLDAQITFYQPQAIIIACGVDRSAISFRNKIFTQREMVFDYKKSKGFPDLFLWKFLANDRGDIPCYRTYHPAAIGEAKTRYTNSQPILINDLKKYIR